MEVKFSDLVGKTIYAIQGKKGDGELIFQCRDEKGEFRDFKMYHSQDCCESVYIEDICGDLSDLLNTPVLKASEDTSNKDPEPPISVDIALSRYRESFTWTFYNIATIKGSVTIRWYGESNGCYSESVDFEEI